jgi:hypothetical protein
MKWISLLSLLLAVSGNAFACKCLDYSLAEHFARASVVFVGSTKASPSQAEKSGTTIAFTVSRSLKGAPPAGSSVSIDPLFGTDCTAPFVPGVQLLVFAYAQEAGAPMAGACTIRAVEPFSAQGKSYQPSAEVIEFLHNVGA